MLYYTVALQLSDTVADPVFDSLTELPLIPLETTMSFHSALIPAFRRTDGVVLFTVKNDPESEVVLRIAEHLNMAVCVSDQRHGASLDNEPNVLERLERSGCHEVWTLEIPGTVMEQAIIEAGYLLRIIDHHEYPKLGLSRMHGRDENPLPSALHQFMELAKVDDVMLRVMGFDPALVHGIGIMDSRLIQGLREEGYTKAMILATLNFRDHILEGTRKDNAWIKNEGRKAWQGRLEGDGYIVVNASGGVASEVLLEAYFDGDRDTEAFVFIDPRSMVHSVRHISPDVVTHLQNTFSQSNTFVFGTAPRLCFGVDNSKRGPNVSGEALLAAFKEKYRAAA